MLGNVVNNLVNTNQSSGHKSVQWNATNNQGQPVSAGVYLYSIKLEFQADKEDDINKRIAPHLWVFCLLDFLWYINFFLTKDFLINILRGHQYTISLNVAKS